MYRWHACNSKAKQQIIPCSRAPQMQRCRMPSPHHQLKSHLSMSHWSQTACSLKNQSEVVLWCVFWLARCIFTSSSCCKCPARIFWQTCVSVHAALWKPLKFLISKLGSEQLQSLTSSLTCLHGSKSRRQLKTMTMLQISLPCQWPLLAIAHVWLA